MRPAQLFSGLRARKGVPRERAGDTCRSTWIDQHDRFESATPLQTFFMNSHRGAGMLSQIQ